MASLAPLAFIGLAWGPDCVTEAKTLMHRPGSHLDGLIILCLSCHLPAVARLSHNISISAFAWRKTMERICPGDGSRTSLGWTESA